MSTQILPGHSFPTPCKRCGGALYRQVDYCPYCGAVHPLEASPHKHTGIPGSRASATHKLALKHALEPSANDAPVAGPGPRDGSSGVTSATADVTLKTPTLATIAPPPAPLAAFPAGVAANAAASTSTGVSTELLSTDSHTGFAVRKVLFGIAGLVAIGLVFVGYALFRADSDAESGAGEPVPGSIQDARTTTGTIARYTPALPVTHGAQTSAAIAPKPVMQNTLAAPAKAVPAIPVSPVIPLVSPAPANAPAKVSAPQFHDAAQALQAANLAFRANNLTAAQAALGAALTLQPGNSDAQDLAQQLKPVAARRDAALQAAQTCLAQQSWGCARQHANETLAIDSGNGAASAILERVIRETGWAPLRLGPAVSTAPAVVTAMPTQVAAAPAPTQTPPTPIAQAPQSAQPAQAAQPAQSAPDPNSIEARERAIRNSGWNHASASNAKTAAGATAGQ